MAGLTASGPALVHFLDFAQLNSVRTLPYLIEWNRRYQRAGLSLIGVQAPRFPFGADPEVATAGLAALGVDFPVALDFERQLWNEYGCRGWPSLFLWSRGGALSWFHFAEGGYLETEEAIQAELREVDALRELPTPMSPLRPTDGRRTNVIAPSPELFPGGSWRRPWTAGADGEELRVSYEAGGVYVTTEGEGDLALKFEGLKETVISVRGAGLYRLLEDDHHQSHTFILRPTSGLRIWSISFAAGVPADSVPSDGNLAEARLPKQRGPERSSDG